LCRPRCLHGCAKRWVCGKGPCRCVHRLLSPSMNLGRRDVLLGRCPESIAASMGLWTHSYTPPLVNAPYRAHLPSVRTLIRISPHLEILRFT
jgi:hypothetical protein